MGYWESPHGVIGDEPADIMELALDDIRAVYHERCEREPTKGEIWDVLMFVLGPLDELPDDHE